ncbi:Na(+)-translocating NADH-quinone reductase subunit F [Clostridiaceae bacterium JG1575]|nr:Na(+)-translocating NADH-quinone reductase subunit F [Clostridiaceae bacterium JG1575]
MLGEILNATISITLIAAVLAIIISISERYLNNYGECKLTINDGAKEMVVEGGSSLLTTLAGQKLFIPSACGGKATCGLCKVQVFEGAGPILPTEEPYLTAKERENHYRLACQIKVKSNMRLGIPEELFNIKEFITTVERLDDLTYDIKGVRLALPEGETISFKAGQFMQFYSKPYDKVTEEVFRAYSISSPPSDNGHVEFCIRQVPDGLCTTWVHKHLKVGDQVRLSGPYGDFYYRGNCDTMIMVAGGSGLAPMRSLTYDNLNKNVDVKMIFYFGARTEEDLYYIDEMRAIEKEHDNFTFIPTLSHPKGEWKGHVGRITDLLESALEDGTAGAGKEAYLCGSPGFLKAVNELLKRKGFDKETQIFYDEF